MRKILIVCLIMATIFVNSVYAADTPLINRIDMAVSNHEEYIDVSDHQLTDADVVSLMTEYFAQCSSAGLINCTIHTFDDDKNGLYDVIQPEYRYSEQMSRLISRQIDRAEDEIISQTTDLSNAEKVKAIYSYFCTHFKYDTELNYDLKHLYETKRGTCAAFSVGFKDIMDKLDIPCKIVISEDMSHEWNEVFIDNRWQNVDITDGIRLYETGFPNAYMRAYLK